MTLDAQLEYSMESGMVMCMIMSTCRKIVCRDNPDKLYVYSSKDDTIMGIRKKSERQFCCSFELCCPSYVLFPRKVIIFSQQSFLLLELV